MAIKKYSIINWSEFEIESTKNIKEKIFQELFSLNPKPKKQNPQYSLKYFMTEKRKQAQTNQNYLNKKSLKASAQ